ncbi:multicopper oxidase [Xylariomycetidae sp. FL0641]|nr:multicopper oxidase [Xylariomycetidae sp. FL0641]
MASISRLASAALLSLPLSAARSIDSVSTLATRATCSGNTATTRSEWCDYSIDTDYMTETPDTGVTREYWLTLDDVTVAPDGVSRSAMGVNGSIPGPTLFADWGDTVKVHITNNLVTSNNGSSVHFHGIRQQNTNGMDGVTSITQCPTAPGDSITQTWRAAQYGSTWYHSHFGLQAWEGVFGGIIINGPATANYDEDLGMVFLNDWDHSTVDELYTQAETDGPPTLDTGLINGTNVYDDAGYRFNVSFTAGTSYRMRLVNAAVDTHFKFSIDNHTMQVIAADLVPIEPFNTTVLSMGMGQRYDIVVSADQAEVADDFWIRAIPQVACSENDNGDDIRGIVTYAAAASEPGTTGYDYDDECDDETDNLTPYVSKTVGATAGWSNTTDAGLSISDSLFKWTLNSTSMLLAWADPTLRQVVVEGATTFEADDAVIRLDAAGAWVYLAITTDMSVAHPIHLHGHDFWVLAQGTGTDYDAADFDLANPARRDTAMLPASGHLVLAFAADNPGAWLMHCHIGWHTNEGFALQFVERLGEIAATVDADALAAGCDAWESFAAANADVEQEDSGV